MTPIELQLEDLRKIASESSVALLANGSHLIAVPKVALPQGWNRDLVTVLFVAPPGYPGAQPDCFWVEPGQFRLQNGTTPQNTNDSNPIPCDVVQGRNTTWFSWHIQSWNPNRDSLVTYFYVIKQRLNPPR